MDIEYRHLEAAIAQWICLHLPSCDYEFESQAYYLRLYSQILCYICHCVLKRTQINKKRMGLAHVKMYSFLDHLIFHSNYIMSKWKVDNIFIFYPSGEAIQQSFLQDHLAVHVLLGVHLDVCLRQVYGIKVSECLSWLRFRYMFQV